MRVTFYPYSIMLHFTFLRLYLIKIHGFHKPLIVKGQSNKEEKQM